VALAETLLVGDGFGRSRVAQLSTSLHQGFVRPRYFERLTDGACERLKAPTLEVGCATTICGMRMV
jgi:hypothetical protein